MDLYAVLGALFLVTFITVLMAMLVVGHYTAPHRARRHGRD